VPGLQSGHPRNYGTVPPVPLAYTGTTVFTVLYIAPAGTQKLREVSAIKCLCEQLKFASCFFHRNVLDS
jgi:hypothetical protein